MKPSLAFDTSALISLGHTELLDIILDNFTVIISKRIHDELISIGQIDDRDGEAAKKWLERIDQLELRKAKESEIGEIELFEICQSDKIAMVTDDIKATKVFDEKIDWIFSAHIIFLLSHKGMISRQRGLYSIEKMRTERNWKDNIIYVTGRMLFQE